jgi:sugar (pentulose or hexulose) kinase
MADIFNTEVVTLKVSEGAAYGAALQAFWCWRRQQGENVSIEEITNQFVELNRHETAQPNARNAALYQELQALQIRCRRPASTLCETSAVVPLNVPRAGREKSKQRADRPVNR